MSMSMSIMSSCMVGIVAGVMARAISCESWEGTDVLGCAARLQLVVARSGKDV